MSATANVSNNAAGFTVNTVAIPLSAGAHVFSLRYSGDSKWPASASGTTTITVALGTDTLPLAYSRAASVASGTQIVFTGTLATNAGGPAPTSSVVLLGNGTTLAQSTLSGNPPFNLSFIMNTSSHPLAAGRYVFGLSYAGDSHWLASNSSMQNITITGIAPGFSLTSNMGSFSSTVQGTTLVFTAAVTGASGLPSPAGSVQFYVDKVAAGGPVPLSDGMASYSTSTLSVGQHSITAAYSGNSHFNSITTNSVVSVVTQGSDSASLTLTGPSTVSLGTPVTINGTLTLVALGPAPTGSVALLDNGTSIAKATLSTGSSPAVSFTVNTAGQPLAAGKHSFGLQYNGTPTGSRVPRRRNPSRSIRQQQQPASLPQAPPFPFRRA